MQSDTEKREWHLDKKVSIGMILVLLSNTCAVTWWASRMEYRASSIEQDVAEFKKDLTAYDNFQRNLIVDLATIRVKVEDQTNALKRIEAALDRKKEK